MTLYFMEPIDPLGESLVITRIFSLKTFFRSTTTMTHPKSAIVKLIACVKKMAQTEVIVSVVWSST